MRPAAPAKPPVDEVESVAPSPVDEPAVRELRGTILGQDGAPPAYATVQVQELALLVEEQPKIPVDPEGAFAAPLTVAGPVVHLQVIAVGHPALTVPVDLRDPDVALDIRLGGLAEPIEAVRAHLSTALEEPNQWSGAPPDSVIRGDVLPAVDLMRGVDGVFTATVEAGPPGVLYTFAAPGEQMKFPDLGAIGRRLPLPPEAVQPSHDGLLAWALAPARDGRAELRLDPARLAPTGSVPQIAARGDAPRTAALVRAGQVARAWGDSAFGLPPAGAATCARAAAEARGLADVEGVARWMHYVEFASYRGCDIAAGDARLALERIDAGEPLWALYFGTLTSTVQPLEARAADRPLVERYFDAVVERHPDANVVADVLLKRLEAAQGDAERARALFKQLKDRRFERTIGGISANSLNPDRIDAGAPVPEFSVPALDGGPPLTRASLLGTPYVLEFWGTWCQPCVEGMAELHTSYARANGGRPAQDPAGWRAFVPPARPAVEFVTIAVHERADAVAEFRRAQWPMPWKHGVVGEKDSQALLERFNLSGVPSTFFVDAAGVVVQREGELPDGLRKLGRRM